MLALTSRPDEYIVLETSDGLIRVHAYPQGDLIKMAIDAPRSVVISRKPISRSELARAGLGGGAGASAARQLLAPNQRRRREGL